MSQFDQSSSHAELITSLCPLCALGVKRTANPFDLISPLVAVRGGREALTIGLASSHFKLYYLKIKQSF